MYTYIFENKRRFFFFLFLLHLGLRISSLYQSFLDVDESQFAGFAHALMDGGKPYTASVDTKPLMIYWFFQSVFTLFGRYNMIAVHAVTIMWTYLTTITLYRIAKEERSHVTACWVAILMTVFSTAYLPKFISTSITSLMILPLSLAALMALKATKTETALSYLQALLGGALVATGFLFKYQGGIQIVVMILFFWVLRKQTGLTKSFGLSLMASVGFIIPVGLFLLYLRHTGVWNDFVLWSFEGSFKYIQAGKDTIPFVENMTKKGGLFVISTLLLWGLTLLRLTDKNKPLISSEKLALLWFFFGLIPVCMGGRFYGHYFLQILPPLCLMAGGRIEAFMKRSESSKKLVLSLMIIPAIIFFVPRLSMARLEKFAPDDELTKQQHIGEFIKNNSAPSDTLFVWGFATGIYFHAERKAVSRFLWADVLTGKVPGSTLSNQKDFDTSAYINPKAWSFLMADFLAHPPTFIVDTASCDLHNYSKYPVEHYPDLKLYLETNFVKWDKVENCEIYKNKNVANQEVKK